MFAMESPAVEAIFSPVTDATENIIDKINPTDKPIAISVNIKNINLNKFNLLISGTLTSLKIKIVIHIDNTILTCKGIKPVEKKGALKSIEEILRETKKYIKIFSYKFVRFKPGKNNSYI